MINLLYLVPSVSVCSKGIFKKQFYKISAFEKAGCLVKPILFTHEIEAASDKSFQIVIDDTLIRKRYSKKIIWRMLPYLLSKYSEEIIHKNTITSIDDIEYAYIRYSGANFHSLKLLKFLKSKKIKIIFEYNGHHYNDEVINFKSNPSVFTFYKYFNEKFFQKKVASCADLIVGVTDELTDYYSKFNPNAIKYTLSNGIDVSKFSHSNSMPYDGSYVNFLFLSGSINYWHGLDRFLSGLKKYSGLTKINLTIAGPVHEEYKSYTYENKNINIVFLKSVEKNELDELFNSNHIGIGSLGLHRMGLKEASVLKVREYIARGLPFLLGYKDTDLIKSNSLNEFYFELPADESAIEINDVLRFSNKVLLLDDYKHNMRLIGIPLIDYQPKIDKLVSVMKQIKS